MTFEGYETLSMSEMERDIFQKLYDMTAKDKIEYGCAAYGNVHSDFFTSHQADFVEIPSEVLTHPGVSLYHSHTNDTLFSSQDLLLLLHKHIVQIGVISSCGHIAMASIQDGLIVDREEFHRVSSEIRLEIDVGLLNESDFWELDLEQRNFRAINEHCYRIARHFHWTLKGGTL